MASCETEVSAFYILSISLLIIVLYHPFWNEPRKHEDALGCIMDIFDFALSTHVDPYKAKTIICGDFNDLRKYSDDITSLTGLKPIVNVATRGKNTLDQIFTDISATVPVRLLAPIGKSDHACVVWTPFLRSPDVRKCKVRKITASNLAFFQTYMHDIDWLKYVSCINDIEEAFLTFLETLKSVYDYCFPEKTIRMRENDPPWLKPSLKLLIDERDRAYCKGQVAKYKRLRLEVTEHIKQLKSAYINDLLLKKDARKSWKVVRQVGRFGKATHAIPNSVSVNDLSDYFASVFQERGAIEIRPTFVPGSSLVLSTWEVERELSRLKRKSCGLDGLPYWIFRSCSLCLTSAVTFLFNWSIRESIVPNCLKKAVITPVPKSQRPTEASDFRPISLLPLLSKVFEKLIARHWLLPYIKDKVKPNQFAYLSGPGSGSTCALTLVYDKIVSFLDRPGAVRVLSIDFAKAFDKLLHNRIVNAAINFRLPEPAVKWIASYLTDRQQCVRVGNVLSSWSPVTTGVPQGSVLGPLLFCIVIDEFSCVCSNSSCIKYADDITILHFIRNCADDFCQVEWDHAIEWAERNDLPLNTSKCCIMNVVTKRNLSVPPIILSNGQFYVVCCLFRCLAFFVLAI